MRPFEIALHNLLLRYYAIMAVIIVGGFTGQWWLAAFGFLIFISAILGVSFKKEKPAETAGQSAKLVQLEPEHKVQKAAS